MCIFEVMAFVCTLHHMQYNGIFVLHMQEACCCLWTAPVAPVLPRAVPRANQLDLDPLLQANSFAGSKRNASGDLRGTRGLLAEGLLPGPSRGHVNNTVSESNSGANTPENESDDEVSKGSKASRKHGGLMRAGGRRVGRVRKSQREHRCTWEGAAGFGHAHHQ